ncbi:MAG TPA: hypothetical protein VFR16_08470, partial [Agromyces mariniharenae]|nr:hypothetical protein [Agromyces mariniharenae]
MLADIKGRVQDAAAHTPAARRTRIDRIVGAVVAAVLALGLGSAGAAFAFGILPQTSTEPEPASIAGPAATAPPARTFPVETAPPAPVDPGPTPRIGLTCDDLLETSALAAFMGDAGRPAIQLAPGIQAAQVGPAAEQLGALVCTWTSGGERPMPDSGLQEVSLSVLPEGLDTAARYVEAYRLADPTYGDHVQGPRCVADGGYCELHGTIGSTWVELSAYGIASAGLTDDEVRASFMAITDRLVDAISAANVAERWSPPSQSATTGATCDDVAPADAIAPLIGVSYLTTGVFEDGPGLGQASYAKREVGAFSCSLRLDSTEASLGFIYVQPSGSWAVTRYSDAWLADDG